MINNSKYRSVSNKMADEAQLEASVKATMSSMGKLIKKPPMTDKLLKKPPFRFLHDVLTEVCAKVLEH